MIKNLNLYFIFAILTLFLPGCILHTEQSPLSVQIKKAKLDTDINRSMAQIQLVPTIPLILSQSSDRISHKSQTLQLQPTLRARYYDWGNTIQLMIDKMLQIQDVITDSVLLVDNVNNRTNGSLNVNEATEILRYVLANTGKFILVSTQQLSSVKQQLGLSPQDSFDSGSKAIGIARNVQAHYVLYSNINGNVNSPSLQIQLILVQTGEIIWSEESNILQFNLSHK